MCLCFEGTPFLWFERETKRITHTHTLHPCIFVWRGGSPERVTPICFLVTHCIRKRMGQSEAPSATCVASYDVFLAERAAPNFHAAHRLALNLCGLWRHFWAVVHGFSDSIKRFRCLQSQFQCELTQLGVHSNCAMRVAFGPLAHVKWT